MPDSLVAPAHRPADRPVVVLVDHLYDYHRRVVDGLLDVLGPAGVPVLLAVCSRHRSTAPAWLVRRLRAGRVGGVVLLPMDDAVAEEAIAGVLEQHPDVPVVGAGVRLAGRPMVTADDAGGMRALMAQLLDEGGARRVALVRGVPHHRDSLVREAVVRAELAARGLALDDDLVVDGHFDRDPSYRAFGALRARIGDAALAELDAVVALNDISAFGVLDVLDEAGLAVPGDVMLTGFDAHPSSAQPDTALSTVDPALREQGVAAAEQLLALRDGGTGGDVVVPTRVVVRSSTGGERPPQPARPVGRSAVASVGLDHTVLAMVRGFADALSRQEVMRELTACLPRLGVSRAFVVLREPGGPAGAAPGDPDASPLGRVLLRFPGGPVDLAADAPFATDDVLPAALAAELDAGVLVRHLLEVRGTELGYVLTEQAVLNGRSVELMRLELSRTLDGIARTEQLARHAVELERLVDERTEQLRAANDVLRASLHLDGLTGIANRVAFDAGLDQRWADGAAGGRPLSVLLVDVDHFKAYNDAYGHLLGDEALRQVAGALRDATAAVPGALGARYGGEEFAVLLPDVDLPDALEVAARLRAGLAARAVEHVASPVGALLTASTGVASAVPDGGSPLELVRRADVALYRAKRTGRDRVCAADPGAPPLAATARDDAPQRTHR